MGRERQQESHLEREIRLRVERFVEEITELVRNAALQSVAGALGAPAPEAQAHHGESASRRATSRRTAKRIRRTDAELAAVKDMLLRELLERPGLRIEELSQRAGYPTAKLKTPLRQLISEGQVNSRGHKRCTRYFTSGSSAG